MKLKGIIYDLDGTLISSEKMNELGWRYAGNKYGFDITEEMLMSMRSLPSMEGAALILPQEKQHMLEEFIDTKETYVLNRRRQIYPLPSAVSTIRRLKKKGYAVWICTSASEDFVRHVLEHIHGFAEVAHHIVWREMYVSPKPSAEPLLVTLEKMNMGKRDVLFVGDGMNDYNSARNANIRFVYFNPRYNAEDKRISSAVPRITSHRQIFAFL
jgi:phosphoglycolate phosphatase-like HAD superfamily hydrolase